MLDPELVFPHHVSPTELASLPVDSEFLLAGVVGHMLVDFSQFEGQATLLADPELMRTFTLAEQVTSEFTEVDERVALLAMSQYFALLEVVVFRIIEFAAAVSAAVILSLLCILLVVFKNPDAF